MMNIYDIRRENLRLLVDVNFLGSQTKLANKVGVGPNLISRLLSGNPAQAQRMGHKLARRIEAALGVTENWMDQPPRRVAEHRRQFLET